MNFRSCLCLLIAAVCLASLLLSGCSNTEPPADVTQPTVITEPSPTKPTYTVKNIAGTDCYFIGNAVYATELGAPILGKDAVTELYKAGDLCAAAERITNIGDAFFYLSKSPMPKDPQEACHFIATLIAGDYDAVGYIEIRYSNNYYCIVYIECNGMYYAVDPFTTVDKWISKPENDCICNADLNILSEKLEAALPRKGKELISIDISGDIGKISGDMSNPHGAKTFPYAGVTIPEGLGQPVLSDEEIDALIAEQDYAKTAATIHTFADAVNYYYRSKIKFDDRRNNNMHGEFSYKQSAWQVLKNNAGQCVTMSNLNHYLLQGDYDEVGYVHVRTPGDGHIMTYILEDGKYYLINSVDYTDSIRLDWLKSYPYVLGCADDFQQIADSLVANMRLGDRELVNLVHLVNTPGDFVNGKTGNSQIYPEGSTVTEYYGTGFTFGKPELDWQSQTRIDE